MGKGKIISFKKVKIKETISLLPPTGVDNNPLSH